MAFVGTGTVITGAESSRGGSGGAAPIPPRLPPLSDVVSGMVFDLDATIAQSYDGTSQLWKNLIPSPADGSAKAAYDFTLGVSDSASTDDPTFVGTADDPAAYFSFDGGDFFKMAANNPDFLNRLHRTDFSQPFTYGSVIRNPASGFAFGLCTNSGVVNNSPTGNKGMNIAADPSAGLQYLTFTGDSAFTTTSASGHAANAIRYAIISYNPATSSCRFWVNSRTKATTTYTRPTCVNPPLDPKARLGQRGTSEFTASGTRLYSAFMTNTFIDNAEVALILDALATRHGRTYA